MTLFALHDLDKGHNIFLFRFTEQVYRREMRIVKMEGCARPLDWIPLEITGAGLSLKRGRHRGGQGHRADERH